MDHFKAKTDIQLTHVSCGDFHSELRRPKLEVFRNEGTTWAPEEPEGESNARAFCARMRVLGLP